MYEELIKWIFFQTIGRILPRLGKKIYPKGEFERDIKIDIRGSNPLNFSLNRDIPRVTLYLEISNRSQYIEMIIEKMFFSIWINSDKGSQPVIYQGKMMAYQRIGKKETKELYWTTELNCYQTEFLKSIKDSKDLSATFNINYDINSKIYELTGQINLENIQCKIEGR